MTVYSAPPRGPSAVAMDAVRGSVQGMGYEGREPRYERLRAEAEQRVEEWERQRNAAGLPQWMKRGGAVCQNGAALPLEAGAQPTRSRVAGYERDFYVARFPSSMRLKRRLRINVRVEKGLRVSVYASCSNSSPSPEDASWSISGTRHGRLCIPGNDPLVAERGIVYITVALAEEKEGVGEGRKTRNSARNRNSKVAARPAKSKIGRATAIAAVARSNYSIELLLQWQQTHAGEARPTSLSIAERVAAKIQRGREVPRAYDARRLGESRPRGSRQAVQLKPG